MLLEISLELPARTKITSLQTNFGSISRRTITRKMYSLATRSRQISEKKKTNWVFCLDTLMLF